MTLRNGGEAKKHLVHGVLNVEGSAATSGSNELSKLHDS